MKERNEVIHVLEIKYVFKGHIPKLSFFHIPNEFYFPSLGYTLVKCKKSKDAD